jgi:hypothetical protein
MAFGVPTRLGQEWEWPEAVVNKGNTEIDARLAEWLKL